MSDQKYKYFTNGVLPIRATLSDDTIIGTETPNRDTGKLEFNHRWGTEIMWGKNSDIDEITKEEFDCMVIDFLGQKKTNYISAPEIGGTE